MKTKMFMLLLVAVPIFSRGISQPEPKIPTIVKENFKKQYPNIKDVDWERENGEYEAEFEMDHVEYAVSYDGAGALIKAEMEVKPSALPKLALDYLAKNAAEEKIKEVTKITRANGEVFYEVEAGEAEYLFEASGAFIKQKVGPVDKNDGD